MTDGMRRLDIERFRELAEAFGGDVDRWPVDVRAEARMLVDTDTAARAALADAAALDAVLDLYTAPELDTAAVLARLDKDAPVRRSGSLGSLTGAVRSRVLGLVGRLRGSIDLDAVRGRLDWSGPLWQPTAAFAAAAALGIVTGLYAFDATTATDGLVFAGFGDVSWITTEGGQY